jgi:acetyltransferase-like isoleucine patch superfamily enzyme
LDNNLSVTIPRETVNDDNVRIIKWLKAAGAQVCKGDELLEVETSKANITVEAEADGYVEILCQAGEEVAVGQDVGRVHPVAIDAKAAAETETYTAQAAQSISKIARKLIAEHGLDPALFRHLSLVREEDVRIYLERGRHEADEEGSPQEVMPAPPPASVSMPSPAKHGKFHDAFSSTQDRGRGIVWLAANYFFRNYVLGLLVRVAPRGIILPLHRLRGVKMGKNCFIDPTALVETAYPENVTLGDDVRIAAHAVIMTHIKAPHYLRETGIMPAVLKPVTLEDHCFIGVNATVMPGVTVGKAAVVASGAVVVAGVPAFSMVAGNPAKVIKRFSPPSA